MSEPNSLLTRERPDIWQRALHLATSLTRYEYAPKMPLADGTVYACGGGAGDVGPMTIKKIEDEIKRIKNAVIPHYEKHFPGFVDRERDRIKELENELARRRKNGQQTRVAVPEGAMEWLLHEVGHFIAATPEERARPNYGLTASEYGVDGDREWQAWAFEEIVLAPFGPSRLFAPPTQRDGAAFAKAGPMPANALRHVERQVLALGLDVEPWRIIYGEWVRWGASKGVRAPWTLVE